MSNVVETNVVGMEAHVTQRLLDKLKEQDSVERRGNADSTEQMFASCATLLETRMRFPADREFHDALTALDLAYGTKERQVRMRVGRLPASEQEMLRARYGADFRTMRALIHQAIEDGFRFPPEQDERVPRSVSRDQPGNLPLPIPPGNNRVDWPGSKPQVVEPVSVAEALAPPPWPFPPKELIIPQTVEAAPEPVKDKGGRKSALQVNFPDLYAVFDEHIGGDDARRTINLIATKGDGHLFLKFWADELRPEGRARRPIPDSSNMSAMTLVPGLDKSFRAAYPFMTDRTWEPSFAREIMRLFDELVAAAAERITFKEFTLKHLKPAKYVRDERLFENLLSKFGDGKPRAAATIAEKAGCPESTVVRVLKHEWHAECYVETSKVPSGLIITVHPTKHRRVNVELVELRQKLSSALKSLYAEGDKDRTQVIPENISSAAREVEAILNELAGE